MSIPKPKLIKYRDKRTNRLETVAVIQGDTGPVGTTGGKGPQGDPGITPPVVNDLTSTSTTEALSAAQGKVLNDKLNSLQNAQGTVVDKDAVVINSFLIKETETFIPTTTKQFIAAGSYLNGDQIIQGDINLTPENIKKDTSIFGVSGTAETYEGYNIKETSEIFIPSIADQVIPSETILKEQQIIKGDINLIAENIKKDVNLFGIIGTAETDYIFEGNATSSDVFAGKTFYSSDKTLKTGSFSFNGSALPSNVLSGYTFYGSDSTLQTGTYVPYIPPSQDYVTVNYNHFPSNAFSGSFLPLSQARQNLSATKVGNYAIFGGGSMNGSTVDAYDTNLTRSTPMSLSSARYWLSAVSIGNYGLFGGGFAGLDVVDAYDTNLTRTIPTVLSVARYGMGRTSIGNYGLFGGGTASSTPRSTVDAYDTNLTRTIPTGLSVARYWLSATSIGNYALFGGGTASSSSRNTVDAYDTNLTRTIPTVLSVAREQLLATSVGNYALFVGGSANMAVDAYDTNLSRITIQSLPSAISNGDATTIGNNAIIAGGSLTVSYDSNLTQTISTSLSVARTNLSAVSIGNYALFGGGYTTATVSTVDAYEKVSLSRTASGSSTNVFTSVGICITKGSTYKLNADVVEKTASDNMYINFNVPVYGYVKMKNGTF